MTFRSISSKKARKLATRASVQRMLQHHGFTDDSIRKLLDAQSATRLLDYRMGPSPMDPGELCLLQLLKLLTR